MTETPPAPVPSFSDIPTDGLIARLPAWLRPYARLMRLDRPVGTWLLLIPCWWGVALAEPIWLNVGSLILFAFGSVIMRGAGCVVNDIYDRDIDKLVERTRTRPLASGEVSLFQALAFLGLLLLLGLGILLSFNTATQITGALALALVFTYPLMKRITWWPQFFLGLTFNWGALLGGTAVSGVLDFPHLLLYAGGIFWTLAYDTIYAHQDKRDDVLAGVKSTALLLGDASPRWIAVFYALTLILIGIAGWMEGLGDVFKYGLAAAGCYAGVQLTLWRMNIPENCLRRFKANRDFGLIILAALILGRLF